MPNAQLMPRASSPSPPPPRGLGASVTLPQDPNAQYQQYQTPQGQTQIKTQAQSSVIDFATGIGKWAGGGPKPNLPSESDIGAMAAAAALSSGNAQLAAAIMLAFQQAALERKVFDALGAPTWAVVLAASVGDIGSAINLAYGELTSLWGSQGCPRPGPPNCTSAPPPQGPGDPNWKSIGGDCDYVHAAWMMADVQDIEQNEDKSKIEVQFRYLFDQTLFIMWTDAINCKMPPPSDRDWAYTLAALWNSAHAPGATYTFQPVAIDPGHDWYDPPHPTYLAWCLSGGPSGYNMQSSFGAGPLTINTGDILPPAKVTLPGLRGITTYNQGQAPGMSTGAKVAIGALALGGAAAGGVGIWAWLTHQAYRKAWGKIWDETGGKVVDKVRGK
jgi:hypothetical protein